LARVGRIHTGIGQDPERRRARTLVRSSLLKIVRPILRVRPYKAKRIASMTRAAINPFASSTEATAASAAINLLRECGIKAAAEVLDRFQSDSISTVDESLLPVLSEIVSLLLAEFRNDGKSPEAYLALKPMKPVVARTAFDLLMQAMFPDGSPDLAKLNEAAILCLGGLLSAANAHENALGFLNEVNRKRNSEALRHAHWVARCRAMGCPENIGAYWLSPCLSDEISFDELCLALERTPLDVRLRRATVRHLVEAGKIGAGLDALAVGLTLPIADGEKFAFAEDLVVLVLFLLAQGRGVLLERRRLQWALAAYPMIADRSVALISESARLSILSFLDKESAHRAKAYFLACAGRVGENWGGASGSKRVLSPFPTRNGKPHVDIVWLEITNFCNQKCKFCPDPFREASRNWLPLEEIKRLIDELARTVSVGSMQLNAYGEPLLHPNIEEILAYIRRRRLPWPTFFTSHGLTLVEKKLKQLSHNYPSGIAISLHNDSQDSYAATRSHKIGDYATLVERVTSLLRQMAFERAASHLRLYQMVCNGAEDKEVDAGVRSAFPSTPERMMAHVRAWENIAAEIAAAAPSDAQAEALINSNSAIADAFDKASHGDGNHLPILGWLDENGNRQQAFMSPRPVGTYANLLLEYDPRWAVERRVVNRNTCSFTKNPSLAIFATGRLGICCLDLNSTATFGAISDFKSLHDALTSPQAVRMFAELSNGIATSRGCQICLGTGRQLCDI
jgi:uncharacterized radical SAM superfamily Fe-S cluster-containing enzyme